MAFPSRAPRGLALLGAGSRRTLQGFCPGPAEEAGVLTLWSTLGAWVSPQDEDPGCLPTDLETAFVPPWASVLSSLDFTCPISIMGII